MYIRLGALASHIRTLELCNCGGELTKPLKSRLYFLGHDYSAKLEITVPRA